MQKIKASILSILFLSITVLLYAKILSMSDSEVKVDIDPKTGAFSYDLLNTARLTNLEKEKVVSILGEKKKNGTYASVRINGTIYSIKENKNSLLELKNETEELNFVTQEWRLGSIRIVQVFRFAPSIFDTSETAILVEHRIYNESNDPVSIELRLTFDINQDFLQSSAYLADKQIMTAGQVVQDSDIPELAYFMGDFDYPDLNVYFLLKSNFISTPSKIVYSPYENIAVDDWTYYKQISDIKGRGKTKYDGHTMLTLYFSKEVLYPNESGSWISLLSTTKDTKIEVQYNSPRGYSFLPVFASNPLRSSYFDLLDSADSDTKKELAQANQALNQSKQEMSYVTPELTVESMLNSYQRKEQLEKGKNRLSSDDASTLMNNVSNVSSNADDLTAQYKAEADLEKEQKKRELEEKQKQANIEKEKQKKIDERARLSQNDLILLQDFLGGKGSIDPKESNLDLDDQVFVEDFLNSAQNTVQTTNSSSNNELTTLDSLTNYFIDTRIDGSLTEEDQEIVRQLFVDTQDNRLFQMILNTQNSAVQKLSESSSSFEKFQNSLETSQAVTRLVESYRQTKLPLRVTDIEKAVNNENIDLSQFSDPEKVEELQQDMDTLDKLLNELDREYEEFVTEYKTKHVIKK